MTTIAASWFSTNEALIQTVLWTGLLGLSLQVSLRAGVFSLAGVGCWGIGAYVTGILATEGWPILASAVAALAASFVVGVGLALILSRLRSLYLAMATFAFVLLVQIVAGLLDVTGGATGLYGVPIEVGTGVLVVVVVAVCLLLTRRERGMTGRMLETIRVDERIAPSNGINVYRQRFVAFVLGCVIGALSGSMYVLMFGTIAPTQVGFETIVMVLTIVVIGGVASWVGTMLGAALVAGLPEVLTGIGDWWPAVEGAGIVLMVLYAPDGILGLVRTAYRWIVTRSRTRSGRPMTSAEDSA